MNTSLASLSKSKGSVLVITALSLVALMGVAGLAIDLSHAEVNKTRLQNLADALALSAAISLNKQNNPTTSTDEVAAEAYARANTLALFKNSVGNSEIKTAIASGPPLDFIFTFANITDLNASTAGDWKKSVDIAPGDPQNAANFVRVTSLNNPMNISTWFAGVIGFNNMPVSTSAVAGFTPITPCDTAPMMMCAAMDDTGKVKDTDCNNDSNPNAAILGTDNDCYGYELNALYCLKSTYGGTPDPLCPSPPSQFGPGNFGWLDLGGTPSLKTCAAGDPTCSLNCKFPIDPVTKLPVVPTQTGEAFGQASQGF